MIRAASDAMRCGGHPRLPTPAPTDFSGTLDELCSRYVLPNLPTPAMVAVYHRLFVAYIHEPDSLLLIRQVRGMERRSEYATVEGVRFKATDNAPAWWTHALLLEGCSIAPGAFGEVFRSIPAHMFDVPATMKTANSAGWHVAHIFDVKDGNTAFATWSRTDAIGRCVRNVHPCNYFLLPKTNWQRWGGDGRVVAYFAELYAKRYADVWSEFLTLAGAYDFRGEVPSEPILYSYGAVGKPESRGQSTAPGQGGLSANCASYESARLLFRASVIEPLQPNDAFCVITSKGTFRMTKADFYRVFENVAQSRSYLKNGYYHYPTVPQKAEPFRLPSDGAEDYPSKRS